MFSIDPKDVHVQTTMSHTANSTADYLGSEAHPSIVTTAGVRDARDLEIVLNNV